MSRSRVYLDWNATAPLRPEARDAVLAALDEVGNPSSVHAEGRRARAIVETAREAVALLVGAEPDAVTFTSGATEANAWVVGTGWATIALAGIEHDSVIGPAERSGARIACLPVGSDGLVDHRSLVLGTGDAVGASLLALQLANNETGAIQPIGEVAHAARQAGYRVLTDATQAAGRIPVEWSRLDVDYLTLSAHKLGGPKGVGALIARDGVPLRPLIAGGGQERRLRAGTENVAAIAGFGAAAGAAMRELTSTAERMAGLRDSLERGAHSMTPSAVIIGSNAPRLPNTSCIALPGRRAELLVAALDLDGLAVSAGAACSSGKVGTSRALEAMRLAPAVLQAAIRVSIGPTTTADDIETFLAAWRRIAAAGRLAA